VITITSTQLDAWIVTFMFPLSRILGMVAVAPLFNISAVTVTTRLIFGLALTIAIVPILPPMPTIPAGSWLGLVVLAEQMLIGIVIGVTLRIAFAAVDFAGGLIGLQMGLSFAVFYDPQNAAQTPVIAEFLNLIALLIYIASNGHLMSLAALAESFTLLPVTTTPFAVTGFSVILNWAAAIFSTGLLLSLPLVAALLIANIALGVLSRVAPQLNLFAIGFPVTLAAGFFMMMLSMPYFGAALEHLYEQTFMVLRRVLETGAG
jgi:flagellar biosynthetic protein FliR